MYGDSFMKNPLTRSILLILITLLVPIGLVIGAVRIVLNPWYPKLEYRTPWFPADRYGFTRAEREHYALIAIKYLNTNKGIGLLMDLRFPSGQIAPPLSCMEMTDCNLMYNNRELQHMIDVKYVLGIALPLGYAIIIGLILLGIWARKGGWWGDYMSALRRGGWLMISILLSLIVLVVSVFDWFFTKFHNVFFSSGTWQFYTSDTLIRLFPERFWMDTFIIVGGIAALGGIALIIIGNKWNQS
jgi:integral membrane protein (TIGR01906 family)